jgi:hypothetical protein
VRVRVSFEFEREGEAMDAVREKPRGREKKEQLRGRGKKEQLRGRERGEKPRGREARLGLAKPKISTTGGGTDDAWFR